MNILSIIKLYGMFGDVRTAIAEQKGESGWWYSRKFIGAVLVFGAAIVLYLTGVTINADVLNQLTDHISNLIAAIVGLYGIIMSLVSIFKKKKDETTVPKV